MHECTCLRCACAGERVTYAGVCHLVDEVQAVIAARNGFYLQLLDVERLRNDIALPNAVSVARKIQIFTSIKIDFYTDNRQSKSTAAVGVQLSALYTGIKNNTAQTPVGTESDVLNGEGLSL